MRSSYVLLGRRLKSLRCFQCDTCQDAETRGLRLLDAAEEKTVQSAVVSSVEQLGINTCLRYGSYLKLLTEDAVSDLPLLMRNIKIFLSTQRVTTAPQLIAQQDGYPGYDWLASTVFLIMAGNMDRSLKLLLNLSSLLTSAFIWPARDTCLYPCSCGSG
ncbi:protein broad-minded-like [Pseudochaenichthys georgianus]|uniref:protein broad-minded-like n=1 Tax=Pseudochaenichthys georgianus TaxID=52239 RepID=UPI0039C03506